VLSDHHTFSSKVPAPPHWFIFFDPPEHSKARALIARAFTPGVVAQLEPRIREISKALLDAKIDRGEMDLTKDYAVPLPMLVIAELIGIPEGDWSRYTRWSEVILNLSLTRSGGEKAATALSDFVATTAEMAAYLSEMIARRRAEPRSDLLTRLVEAEVDGERLSHEEILGFFQLLLLAGQETTTNLISNSIICLLENEGEYVRRKASPELIPSFIEEVLRFRSPLQWVMRTPQADVELHGQTIPAGALVLAMIGSANRDPKRFSDPDHFDCTRSPNPHLAFGHGIHSCLGAALSRLEGRIAIPDLLARLNGLTLASADPWQPRTALHVHGPARLPIRFEPGRRQSIDRHPESG
jgi:cytochrome P450